MKRAKRITSIILVVVMVLTVCFQHGMRAKAADAGTPVETDISAIWSGQNGQMITFQLSNSDWNSHGQQNVVPGSTYNTYNFYEQIQIYYNDGTGEKSVSLREAHFDQIYLSMWGNTSALSIQINSAYYPYATKIVVPKGTIFPSFAYTGGTPLGGTTIASTSSSMNGYITTEDIIYEGPKNASSQTYWSRAKSTQVENIKFDLAYSGVHRMIFNISGDADNDALPNWCYIDGTKIDMHNVKDYVEIYLKGESAPKTLRDLFKTSDGNMYWNLYEPGSMTFPIADNFSDATTIEKIVVKKGCQFPSVAYTGANDPVGGGIFSPTTNSQIVYTVQEDMTFVISADSSAVNATFLLADTSAPTETAVTGVKTGHSNKNVTFTLSATDYEGCSTNRVGDRFLEYNFMDKIQIVSGEQVQTLRDVYPTGEERYYNLWDMQNTFTIALGAAYDSVTKIVIPAGTVFPSAAYTGYGAWNDMSAPSNTGTSKGGFETGKDITYVKPEGTGELIWTEEAQRVDVDTTVETLDIKDGRMVFNISNDVDNDALTEWTFIWQAQHDAYNFKDNIEIYISGEGAPKTLKDIFNTSDGNLYWNLYEAGSMSIPLIAGAYDCTTIEKIVVKAGCEFPSVAFTGGNSLTGGAGTAATQSTFKAYVVGEDITFVPSDGTTTSTAAFEILDPNATTETNVTGVKTGHSNKNVTFTLSTTDYEGCDTNRPSGKFADYNFMDNIQIYSGDTVQSLKDVYVSGDEIYYNLAGTRNTLTIALGTAFDTATKIVIPAGTVFPSATYTGYGAWDDMSIPDNMVTIKGGFETTSDVTYLKPEGSGELLWVKDGTQPVEEDTSVTNIHVRTGGDGTRLLFFLSENDYGTQDVNVPVTITEQQYHLLDNVLIHTVEGEKFTLSEVFAGDAMYNVWGEYGTFSVKLKDGMNPIDKVEIKEGCEFPSREYTAGNRESKLTYVNVKGVVFSASTEPQDNVATVHWTRTEVVPTVYEETEVAKIQMLGRKGNARLVIFLSAHDYNAIGDSVAVTDKYQQYNTLENIVLVKGDKEVVLSDIVTDEVYYNLWGNQGSVSYGLQPEYSINSFDKVIVKDGCEFPSYVYTSADTAESKIAYTVQVEQSVTITEAKYKITYYGEDSEVLYEDFVVCGQDFELRTVPEKSGYIGTWEGLKYDVMPAEHISYYLTYEASAEDEKEPDTEKNDDSNIQAESPKTGDTIITGQWIVLILCCLFAVSAIVFKKSKDQKLTNGGEN